MHSTRLSPKIVKRIREILLRPAMYVGKTNYDMAVSYISGYAWGADEHAGLHGTSTFQDFQQFLAKKYRRGNASFNNVVWFNIIPLALRQDGSTMSEQKLIDQLLADFNDFNNVLVRMAVEADFD